MKSPGFNKSGIAELLSSNRHSCEVVHERHKLVRSRVRLAAATLSVLTLAWILIDAITLEWPLSGILGGERACAAAAFLMVAVRYQWADSSARAVAVLFLIPVLFLLSAYIALQEFAVPEESIFVSTAYSYAPFLLAASLSVFPLTAMEFTFLTVPIFLVAIVSLLSNPGLFASAPATLLRLLLILVVSAVAGMSQLRLLMALTEQSVRDRLTGALTRRAGEQRIKSGFRHAERMRYPLSLIFFDLDNFKSINDRFGHDAGDRVLRSAADTIFRHLKVGDSLVRWGGEELIAILPQTDLMAALEIVQQLGKEGFGQRPDGQRVTASIGVAERLIDMVPDPTTLIHLSDKRMYAAKAAGRNCYVCGLGEAIRFLGRFGSLAQGGEALQLAGIGHHQYAVCQEADVALTKGAEHAVHVFRGETNGIGNVPLPQGERIAALADHS